jgi:hypothetical protein
MPWPVHPTGFFGARGDNDTYRIERSLRFNSADSAYLNRTFGSGSRKTFTYSFWAKRSSLSNGYLVSAFFNASNQTNIQFASDNLQVFSNAGGATQLSLITTQVFRDPSAWYHFVVAFDTTQATSSNRVKIYVNGSEVTSFGTSTYPSQNADTNYGDSATANYIGSAGASNYLNGYLAEVFFIDGQALTPSSFGETDAITGRWKAKAYSGTYGTNGFYLKFADNSGTTSTTLGKDSSGNGNNWTPNNFSVTAGAGNDSLVDSPTNYGTDTGVGGEVRGNYCTWNPLVPGDSATNGNLDVTNDTARGNQELMKYNSYWEVTSTGGTCLAGIISTAATSTVTVGSAKTFGFKLSTAGVLEYANVTDGSSFTSQATATTPPLAYASTGASITASLNAGQRPFVATAPSGFKALCTTNLPQPTIQKPSKYMDVIAYTGTGASNSISSLGFSPDLVWIKNRGTTTSHAIYDTTRGVQNQLSSDTTGDAVTSSSGLTAFDTNGFTIGTSSLVNTSGTQYVAWSWDEAPIAGMDIVSYTGNGANRTIAHNLGVAPKMMIVKARVTASTDQGWPVYHTGVASDAETDYLLLNSTAAAADLNTVWNDTAPTSSVFSVGTNALVNTNNDTYIAYLFAEVEGFSKFGSYTGNGSAEGPFVWCGFRPRWVMVKASSSTSNWIVFDTSRLGYNGANDYLLPNSSSAEGSDVDIDILSNGFKPKDASGPTNVSSVTYIFAAFAESPFKYARAR